MDIDKQMQKAIKHYWRTRRSQIEKQASLGKTDAGSRGSATGGAQMDGFIELLKLAVIETGVDDTCIFCGRKDVILPGFFRPTKQWDILVIEKGQLLVAIEAKSQKGSFGNNFNNRVEESLGCSTDIWRAYQNGQFGIHSKPFIGYLLTVEDHEKSRRVVKIAEPHFPALKEFADTSYQDRYCIFCRKLILERQYTSVCISVSDEENGLHGRYHEPDSDLAMSRFIHSLKTHVMMQRS